MKIPDKKYLRQIVINQSSDIEFKDFLNLCQKMCRKTTFLVNDSALASDNLLRFKRNLLERI